MKIVILDGCTDSPRELSRDAEVVFTNKCPINVVNCPKEAQL